MAQENQIRAIRVGSITVNLHNVSYIETIEGVDDDDKPVKALWVNFIGGRNVRLISGDADRCEHIRDYIEVCMGQFLNLDVVPRMEEPDENDNLQ